MRQPHLKMRGPWQPPLDQVVQYDFAPGYVVFTLPCPKRIRVIANGQTLADSSRVITLYESDHIPIYYFPLEDIRMDLMGPGKRTTHSPYKGDARHYSLKGGGEPYEDIMWHYDRPVPGSPDLSGHASFYWHEVDRWFEEDEEVFVHVRDPFRRVDCLPSTRRVTVEHRGQVVADSGRGVFLFENGLPTRHYLPRQDVDATVLESSALRTQCPYKGEAHYHHLNVGGNRLENAVWFYPDPVEESARIRGLLCFAGELVDRISVDGQTVERPVTAMTKGYNYHGYRD